MATKLTFEHDVIGNIMNIQKCPSYREQDSDEIGDGVVGRMHPDTGEVESLEILFYSYLVLSREPLRLKIPVAPGRVCGEPAAPEFDALVQPNCPWLTIPPDAAIVELYIPGYDGMPMPAAAAASAAVQAPDAAMV